MKAISAKLAGSVAALLQTERSGRAVAALRGARGDERGVTALEYGIIATFLALSLITIFTNYSNTLSLLYSSTTSKL